MSCTEYLIKWQGYDSSENSWESVQNLNCSSLIEEFEEKEKLLYDKWKNERDRDPNFTLIIQYDTSDLSSYPKQKVETNTLINPAENVQVNIEDKTINDINVSSNYFSCYFRLYYILLPRK